jgi:hypothetical protein
MMYFVEKVKFKEISADIVFPKHDILGHCYSLEDALKLLKEKATDYMVKKTLEHTDKTNMDSRIIQTSINNPNQSIRFTMRSNSANRNIIDIYREEERVCKGWTSSSIKRNEKRIAYFVYSTYDTVLMGNSENINEHAIPVAPAPPAPKSKNVLKTLVGKELKLIEDHSNLVKELRENTKYLQLRDYSSGAEIIDEELEKLGLIIK